MAIMFITHNLGVIAQMTKDVIVMYLGKVVEEATVDEIFYNPKHPYTEALLSSVPRPDPTATKKRIMLEGEVPSPAKPPSGCHFHPRCRYAVKVCKVEVPRLREVGPGHMAACHRADELRLSGVG